MSGLLLRGEFDVVGANVIELGSGLGLSGIACVTAGARSVAFTEYKPTLLDICFENAKRNTGKSCSGFVLDWSDFSYKTHEGFSNWRSEHPGDFLVVGSELVYDETHADMVIGVLSQLFEAGARAGLIVIMLKPSREGATKFLATLSENKESVPFTCLIREVQCEDGNVAACIHLSKNKGIE
jgi:predicted nicotinamide N-methyase